MEKFLDVLETIFLSLFEKKKFVELILSELLTPLKDYQNVLLLVLPFNFTIGKL